VGKQAATTLVNQVLADDTATKAAAPAVIEGSKAGGNATMNWIQNNWKLVAIAALAAWFFLRKR
jgi:hypothetical protein